MQFRVYFIDLIVVHGVKHEIVTLIEKRLHNYITSILDERRSAVRRPSLKKSPGASLEKKMVNFNSGGCLDISIHCCAVFSETLLKL